MSSASVISANAAWFLVGPFDSEETIRHMPIYTFPFLIGRRQDVPLSLSCKTVSAVHAEITEVGSALVIRDLGSTNGTYVNGNRVEEPVVLAEDDLVQFANLPFRVRMQSTENDPHTVRESAGDRALALVLFDKLMSERAVTPFLQPIIDLKDRQTVAYEVLARSRLFGLEMPGNMFGVAPVEPGSGTEHDAALGRGTSHARQSATTVLVPQHASPRIGR